jgi:hypothetical protein
MVELENCISIHRKKVAFFKRGDENKQEHHKKTDSVKGY